MQARGMKRKPHGSGAQKFFSNKPHIVVVRGGKGTATKRMSKSAEYAPYDGEVELVPLDVPGGDKRYAAVMLLEFGFDKSVHKAINDAVFQNAPFDKNTHTIAIKKPSSGSVMEATLVYRHTTLDDLTIYEVLFLSVHTAIKRSGMGRCMVDMLKKKLTEISGPTCLCVSLKSESSEAAHFWTKAGLSPLTSSDARAEKVEKNMVGFDDFRPYACFFASH